VPRRAGLTRALAAARDSGLVPPGAPLLVLLSGGVDSVCLLDVAVELGAEVEALHVNYGLRTGADGDEQHCRDLCGRLGVELVVERARLPAADGAGGNLQAHAREARYALAERHARGGYAAAHTASDQAETVLYRLAVSPGRRALLGMAARRGSLVRPLLGATRADTRAHCEQRGLGWRDDPSNEDRRFARARIRHDVLPGLRALNPAVERSIAETSLLLRDEAEVLDRAVGEALAGIGSTRAVGLAELRALPPALARLALRRLAEAAGAGRDAPASILSRRSADAILALPDAGSKTLDLGGGLRAVAEYGVVRFARAAEPSPPGPVALAIPGRARLGAWEIAATLDPGGEAELDMEALGDQVIVRTWRHGDRMRPAGLGGTKSLQDLFTDRKIPRALRASLPVVEAAGEIAWVAGVAVDERFAGRPANRRVVYLSARS